MRLELTLETKSGPRINLYKLNDQLIIPIVPDADSMKVVDQVIVWLRRELNRSASHVAIELAWIFLGEPSEMWKEWKRKERSGCYMDCGKEPDKRRPWPKELGEGKKVSIELQI